MTILYKLTDRNGRTYGGCQWGEMVTHETNGKGEICGKGWLHAFPHPLLAAFLYPIFVDYDGLLLWEAEGEVEKEDYGLKVGTRKLTTIRQIPLPQPTLEQRIIFAILCAMEVCKDEQFQEWGRNWLSGKDRSKEKADEIKKVVWEEAAVATWAGEEAAKAVTWAATETGGTWAAARAVTWAAMTKMELDLVALAEKAMAA